MALPDDIVAYHARLDPSDRELSELLAAIIDEALPEAEHKVWHAHPVWFLDGNPIVGYHRLKSSLRLMFWSGQSFTTPGLAPEGTFQAAEVRYPDAAAVDETALRSWLAESRAIQWDYGNIRRNRGLVKLTEF